MAHRGSPSATEHSIRILIVTNFFPPFHIGGYELRCREVATRLAARGHQVRVLTGRFGVPTADPAATGPIVHAPPAGDNLLVERALHLSWGPPYPPEDLAGFLQSEWNDRAGLARQLQQFDPDLVSLWGMEFASHPLVNWLAAAGRPLHVVLEDVWLADGFTRDPLCQCSAAIHELGIPLPGELAPLLSLGIARPAVTDAHANFVSRFLAQRYHDSGFRCAQSHVRPAGIDLARLGVITPSSRSAFSPDDPLRVLFLGAVTESRGVLDLCRAAQQATQQNGVPLHLRLIGACAPELHHRLTAAAGASLTIEVSGPLPPTQVPGALAAADVLVAPSRLPEGLPRVLMEALAAGVPVIASNSGAQPEILAHGSWGDLVSPGDVPALAQLLCHRRAYAAGWNRRAAVAREHALRAFDIEDYVASLEGQWEHCRADNGGAVAAPPALQPEHWHSRLAVDFADRCGAAAELAAQKAPRSAAHAWRLGVLLKRCARPHSARAVLETLLNGRDATVPDQRRALFHLGECALLEADWAAARRAFEQCLAVAPEHRKAEHNLEHAARRTVPPHLQALTATGRSLPAVVTG